MKLEKVIINGKGYYHYLDCGFLDLCERCCFMKKYNNGAERCELPFRCKANSYYVRPDDCPVKIANTTVNIDVPPPPEGSIDSHIVPNDQYVELKADKVKKEGGIGKRPYNSFPSLAEVENICRHLSFNLGTAVTCVCRSRTEGSDKKIEDLRRAMDYLDNEIRRLEEYDD